MGKIVCSGVFVYMFMWEILVGRIKYGFGEHIIISKVFGHRMYFRVTNSNAFNNSNS